MIWPAILALATSFAALYLERHELLVVYPFDTSRAVPADARFVEREVRASDGARLVLWVRPGAPGRPVVLYLPGNSGTLASREARLAHLAELGYGIVALAYRGSGGSEGKPQEAALLADAALVADAVPRLVGPAPALVLYGESFGAAVAVQLAAAGRGDAAVLEAPFTTLPDLVRSQLAEAAGIAFTQIWDSRAAAAAIRQPLLVLHGEADRLVPVAQGQEVFDRARSSRKRLLRVPGAGHGDLWGAAGLAAIEAFLAELTPPRNAAGPATATATASPPAAPR